jgi:hypothetical protein
MLGVLRVSHRRGPHTWQITHPRLLSHESQQVGRGDGDAQIRRQGNFDAPIQWRACLVPQPGEAEATF